MAHPPAGLVRALSADGRLDRPLGPGRVLAVHRRACTLETDAGDLITLADPGLGNGPDAILVAPGRWPAGAEFRPDGPARLRFDSGPTLDWAESPRWSAEDSAPAAPPRCDPREALIGWLGAAAVADGLLPVLLGRPAAAPHQRALAAAARPLLAALPDPAAARGLVGLGPGLTPAGDDLLAGMLLALYYARHPALPALAAALDRPATTRLGAALIGWALHGRAAEHTLVSLRALFSQPFEQASRHLPPALARGATSGADTLAGIAIGLRIVFQD
ncbi:MAG TPA: DUF2877 domain-containing protein [Herpetosiphonaceae bacterium]|nr:DUF2877 domain-containing protein [Herpetosiphonaceae bacterium]